MSDSKVEDVYERTCHVCDAIRLYRFKSNYSNAKRQKIS